jgi:hypothetical protein
MQLAPLAVPQALIVGGHDLRWAPPGRAYYFHAVTAGDTLVRLVDAPTSGHFDLIAPTTATWSLVVTTLDGLMVDMTPLGTSPRSEQR